MSFNLKRRVLRFQKKQLIEDFKKEYKFSTQKIKKAFLTKNPSTGLMEKTVISLEKKFYTIVALTEKFEEEKKIGS